MPARLLTDEQFREQLASRAVRSLCILKPSALGDVVQSIPLLEPLRARFPDARIAWVVHRSLAPLLTGHPCLNDVLPCERRPTFWQGVSFLRRLRQQRFDLVLDLQGLARTGLMALASGAPLRIGLQTAREGSHLAMTGLLAGTTRDVPAHARYWRLAQALGQGDQPARTQIVVAPEDELHVSELLGSDLPRPWLAVQPGARWETKRWPVERYAEAITRLTAARRASIVIVGAPDEAPDCARLASLLHSARPDLEVRDLAGQTNLKQLAHLLKRIDLLLGNDSGPMHLAAGLGTPTVSVFTCTSAERSGPPGSDHIQFQASVGCAASYFKRCPHRGTAHHACFGTIDAGAVAKAGLETLARQDGGSL